MSGVWPELLLVAGLVAVNAVLAGSEIALISLRESQINQLERTGRAGAVVARLARDPNRFLATIQIGITLAGFLASAAAAVSIADPLTPHLGFFGDAAYTVAVITVTLVLAFITLVLGELAPKRLALQRAERWALLMGRPVHGLAVVTKPIVWLLGVATDLVVKLFGGEPESTREEVDLEELREMVIANRALQEDHQEVVLGALEVAERTLGEVLTPRPDVFTLTEGTTVVDALRLLTEAGHGRAPVVPVDGDLDDTAGVVSLPDLVVTDPDSRVEAHVSEALELPESVAVIAALRRLQEQRQQMALVIDEFGGVAGIVTVEDLVEELVGEIYDQSDRDVMTARRETDGSIVVSGRFPIHDLVDLGIAMPEGEYTTVAGLVLDTLGRIARRGDRVVVDDWEITVLSLRGRTVGWVRFRSPLLGPPKSGDDRPRPPAA